MDTNSKQFHYEGFGEIIIQELNCTSPVDEAVVIHSKAEEMPIEATEP